MIEINSLIKASIKSGNKSELKVYRNLKSKILEYKTAKNAKPYDEGAEIQIIKKYIKSCEDAISQFSEANREDLVSECRDELEVLNKLIPEPVSEREVLDYFFTYCEENGYFVPTTKNELVAKIPKKDMGQVIKDLKEIFPTVDGKEIALLVKNNLDN